MRRGCAETSSAAAQCRTSWWRTPWVEGLGLEWEHICLSSCMICIQRFVVLAYVCSHQVGFSVLHFCLFVCLSHWSNYLLCVMPLRTRRRCGYISLQLDSFLTAADWTCRLCIPSWQPRAAGIQPVRAESKVSNRSATSGTELIIILHTYASILIFCRNVADNRYALSNPSTNTGYTQSASRGAAGISGSAAGKDRGNGFDEMNSIAARMICHVSAYLYYFLPF